LDLRLVADLHAARPAAERVCKRLLGSGHSAEDCVSEAIAMALADPSRLDGVENVAGWLVTVSRRRAVDALRREERIRRSHENMLATTCHVDADPAEEVADRDEAAWLVASASASMPATTWSVMSMRSSGASVHDVADSLGLTSRSVESHLLRARRYLKGLLVAAGAAVACLRKVALRAPVAVSLAGLSVVLCLQPRTQALVPVTTPEQLPEVTRAVAAPRPHLVSRQRAVEAAPVAVRRQPPPTTKPDKVVADGGVVTVTEKDRGGADDPVGGTLKCINEFRIDPPHIGC
jgi:RNA polymerase sigma-70 factor (ECF subfamily)